MFCLWESGGLWYIDGCGLRWEMEEIVGPGPGKMGGMQREGREDFYHDKRTAGAGVG